MRHRAGRSARLIDTPASTASSLPESSRSLGSSLLYERRSLQKLRVVVASAVGASASTPAFRVLARDQSADWSRMKQVRELATLLLVGALEWDRLESDVLKPVPDLASGWNRAMQGQLPAGEERPDRWPRFLRSLAFCEQAERVSRLNWRPARPWAM